MLYRWDFVNEMDPRPILPATKNFRVTVWQLRCLEPNTQFTYRWPFTKNDLVICLISTYCWHCLQWFHKDLFSKISWDISSGDRINDVSIYIYLRENIFGSPYCTFDISLTYAYALQIGPFWQDTLDICEATHQSRGKDVIYLYSS